MQENSAHPRTASAARLLDNSPAESSSPPTFGQVQVRTWLGDHLITDFTTPAGTAPRHIAGVSRLWSGLRLTVDAVRTHPAGDR
jgi:hypothetical protein